MKYFMCVLDGMVLGIPSAAVARIIPAPRTQDVLCEIQEGELFISLPILFDKNSVTAPHGIILREGKKQTILLAPRIETDIDIPEEKIETLPALIGERLSWLNGAYFTKSTLVLLLDTVNLLQHLQGAGQ
jgi:hypothetical protein